MKLLVVGSGEMGRWVGGVVVDRLDDAEVAFADRDRSVAESAADEIERNREAGDRGGAARAVPLATDERFDAVCVAVPVSAAEAAIESHASKAERAVFDVTGTMADPVAAMAEAAPDRERASLHPLFSASNAPGNVAVVVDEAGPTVDRTLDALREAGNRVVETTPAEHDDAMETVQAGTHVAVLSFALAAGDVPEGLATPVYEDLAAVAEQVAGNEPRVYAEIQESFAGASRVAEAAARLADADSGEFAALYREASETVTGDDR